ncbi:MAG: hypothetical protein WC389_00420 [Lutibacter sp.]|jgi:uncharacterized protein YneF (UPF0154 family)
MSYIIEILKYIGPFAGVYLGWYLARKSEKDKIKNNEQKIIKSILFIMLEIRNGLIQLKKIDKSLRILMAKIKQHQKFDKDEKTDPKLLRLMLRKMMDNLNGENNDIDLNQKFNLCIENLSGIKPLLAYKINGKQNVRKYVDDWESEIRELVNLDNVADIEKTLEHFKPKLIDEIKSDLNEIIKNIVTFIDDKNTKIETKELLIELTEKEFEKDFSDYIDKILN